MMYQVLATAAANLNRYNISKREESEKVPVSLTEKWMNPFKYNEKSMRFASLEKYWKVVGQQILQPRRN